MVLFFTFADLEWPIVAGYGRRHEMSFKWVPKACQCTGKYVRALGAWIETPKNGCKTRKMAILGQKSHIAEFSVAGNVPYGCPPHPKNFFRPKKFPKCLQKKIWGPNSILNMYSKAFGKRVLCPKFWVVTVYFWQMLWDVFEVVSVKMFWFWYHHWDMNCRSWVIFGIFLAYFSFPL